jgi:hypothetical protein
LVSFAEKVARRPKKNGKKKKGKKWNRKMEEAAPANYATHQVLVAFGAGDSPKRTSRGCSSLHSAHT